MESTDHLRWRKARASAAENGCVEVADRSGTVLVRDTKARERGHLAVELDAWRRFVAAVKADVRLAHGHVADPQPSRLRVCVFVTRDANKDRELTPCRSSGCR